MMSATQAGYQAPPHDHAGAAPPTPIWISHRLQITLIVGAVVLLALAMWLVPGILTIVLGGVGLALILSHPVGWLSRVMPRGLAILVALLLLLGGIALALAVLIPLLIDQLTELIATWPSIQDTLIRLLDEATQGLRARGLLPEEGASLSDRIRADLSVQAQVIATGLLVGLLDVASGAAGFAVQVFAILFIAIYLLVDVRKVRDTFIGLPPERYRADADALWHAFGVSMSRYLSGVVFVAAFQGVLTSVALWALGVPYALLLGVWVALTSVIPTFGAWLGAVPAVLLAITQSPTTAILTVLLYVIIQQVESNILTPRVQGQAAHVHPIIVLLMVIWTAQALGLLWSALAVPALVVFRVLFDFFRVRLRVWPEQPNARS
jgi:predicted PurR-regulated permease PerM